MGELELITAALAAGGSAGVTAAASSAVQDTYASLKNLLKRRLAGRSGAGEMLEAEETDPGVWQARLGDDLTTSGATGDQEILTAARQLLELLDPTGATADKYRLDLREAKGVQVGDHNTQHNTFS